MTSNPAPYEDSVQFLLDHGSDAAQLAWYRATFDDDQADDDLVLTRLAAWGEGRSVGPFVQGIPQRQT